MASLKPLIMRANRLLGATLVEQELVSIDDLDEANERLAELMGEQANAFQVSLLSVLVNEKGAVKEDDLLEILVEEHGLGLLDLDNIDYPEELKSTLDVKACWATLTVPFDQTEDTLYLATAYYLSPAVRSHWEENFADKNLVWFASTVESLNRFLERCEVESAPVDGAN